MNDQERELDLMVAELEQENRLMRARNDRLQAENKMWEAKAENTRLFNQTLSQGNDRLRAEVANLRARLDTHVGLDPKRVEFLRKENVKLWGWGREEAKAAGTLQRKVRELEAEVERLREPLPSHVVKGIRDKTLREFHKSLREFHVGPTHWRDVLADALHKALVERT